MKKRAFQIRRYGWQRDLPDHRDYAFAAPLAALGPLPAKTDLRPQCPPVYDQGQLGSCRSGHAPLPKSSESVVGGHAVVAVGYDDAKQWFIVRNSWGAQWGMKGYFTLPYAYVMDNALASDFWTVRVVQ